MRTWSIFAPKAAHCRDLLNPRSRPLVVAPLLAALAACRGSTAPDVRQPAGPVTVVTEDLQYRAGGVLSFVLTNGSDERLNWFPCGEGEQLEVRAGRSWLPVPQRSSDRVCNLVITSLTPGASTRAGVQLPADAAAGVYRYRVAPVFTPDYERYVPDDERYTNEFTLVR